MALMFAHLLRNSPKLMVNEAFLRAYAVAIYWAIKLLLTKRLPGLGLIRHEKGLSQISRHSPMFLIYLYMHLSQSYECERL